MSQKNTAIDPYQRSLNHVLTNVLPQLQAKFQLDTGKKVERVQFRHDESKKGEEQFQSVAIFGTIVYEYESKDSAETEKVSVIIKMLIGDEANMKWNNGGVQFLNEVALYDDFLPYFSTVVSDINNIFPDFVYGFVSDSDNRLEDIIILKDLVKEGYRLATSKSKLSLDHILLALQSLGRFHAASYIMKSIDKATFMRKVSSLKEIRNWVYDPADTFQNFLAKNGERGIRYLESIPQYKDKLESIREFLTNITNNLPRLFETNEVSVLCHGDFCRNNMFFKYEKSECNVNDEVPNNVKFFDMANITHASPVIDIAFFLYLNTVQEQRVHHWDSMIRGYYNSLKETCEAYGESSKTNIQVPTYEEILEEFKLKSMMSYLSCSFFLPMMMEKKVEDRSLWGELNDEDLIQHRLKTSGEEGTKAVGEILMHIIDNNFM